MEQRKYTAFISYRHDKFDSFVAKTLHSQIEKFKIPRGIDTSREKMGLVFRDEEELHTASDLSEEIRRALDNSEFLIVICSERTVRSKWVPKEIDYFLQHHDREHILAVLASGEPQDVFPAQLTPETGGSSDNQAKLEPLALDVRAKTRMGARWKIKRELPRLLAPLIPCNYAELAMREQKRKFFGAISATALVLAVTLGFSGMLMFKNDQIARKNDELIRQKAEVQLRESQLLTLDAQEALADAQYSQALEYALAALPKTDDEDRPYYAPAERALMDAMNVFGHNNDSEILGRTTLEQMTAIADFAISKDGTRVVSVDNYGSARCFDAENGSLLWSNMVSNQAVLSPYDPKTVIFPADQKSVICGYGTLMEAYDLQNGDCLWSCDLQEAETGYLFYHEKTDVLLYAQCDTEDYEVFQHHLHVVSARTGQLQQTITLTDENQYHFERFDEDDSSAAGTFSEDGTIFFGVFFDSADTMHCFAADLTQGTAEIVYHHDTPGTYSAMVNTMHFDEESNALLLAVQNLTSRRSLSLLRIDCVTGSLQWQTDPEWNSEKNLFADNNINVLLRDEMIVAAVYDTMYSVDRKNGDILASVPLSGTTTALQMVSDTIFGLALDSGDYTIGWLSGGDSIAFSSDPLYQISVPIPEHSLFKIWEGGIVQYYAEGTLLSLSISNKAGPGYIAYVPATRDNTICIMRPTTPPVFADRVSIELSGKVFDFSDSVNAVRQDHRIFLGPMYEKDSQTYDSTSCMLTIDTNSNTLRSVPVLEEFSSFSDLFPLPDGSGYIISTYDAIASVTGSNDAQILYSVDLAQSAADQAGKVFCYSAVKMASGYQAGTGTLLSAATDMDSLTLWQNGHPGRAVSLPKHLHLTRLYTFQETRLLKVGRNGWILTSFHQSNHDVTMESLAVYDTAHDRWATFIHDTTAVDADSITLAEEKNHMAVLDTNGSIRIYDLDTGEEITQFPTQLSASAVVQMDFLLDDRFLILRTANNQVCIYDIASAALLFSDYLGPSYDTGPVRVFEDNANHRLYLAVGNSGYNFNGLCLELGSWTCLGYIDGLLYFDTDSGILYQCITSVFGDTFTCTKIPGTAELVQAAEKLVP